jgi:hypothetical protein
LPPRALAIRFPLGEDHIAIRFVDANAGAVSAGDATSCAARSTPLCPPETRCAKVSMQPL